MLWLWIVEDDGHSLPHGCVVKFYLEIVDMWYWDLEMNFEDVIYVGVDAATMARGYDTERVNLLAIITDCLEEIGIFFTFSLNFYIGKAIIAGGVFNILYPD